MTNQSTTPAQASSSPKGWTPPPPDVWERMLRRERFMIRWFNFSMLSYRNGKARNMPMVATCILTTKGRKSGKWIEQPIYYFRDGENYAVIASKGGMPKHPVWFLNLEADPNCKIYVNWRTHNVRARVATGEERARIWANAAKLYPDYNDYQVTANPRVIPVVVLEKRTP
ncbi:MAG: nitroreductase family deazaflavin-dependent oxidoreductase [Rhodospirillaceae bacterium]|nr:MAG: nitroreductase family deazaflavin-dependent oxidoreductase [Rhodospirillaceae bacterium]